MGVALQQWRAAIGCFAQPGPRKDDSDRQREDQAGYSYMLKRFRILNSFNGKPYTHLDDSNPLIVDQTEMCLRTVAGLVYIMLALVIMISCQINLISLLSFDGEYILFVICWIVHSLMILVQISTSD